MANNVIASWIGGSNQSASSYIPAQSTVPVLPHTLPPFFNYGLIIPAQPGDHTTPVGQRIVDTTSGLYPSDFAVARASTASYWDFDGVLKYRGNNEARLDYIYNGSAWVLGGLLVEPSVTSEIVRRDLTVAGVWSTFDSGAVTVGSAQTALDGSLNAYPLTIANTALRHAFYSSGWTKVTTNPYNFSAIVKPLSTYTKISIGDVNANNLAVFDTASGGSVITTYPNTGWTITNAKIEDVDNTGNFRISCTITPPSSATLDFGFVFVDNAWTTASGNPESYNWTGNGLASWLVQELQWENSSVPTSFIPNTTTSPVTRAADDYTFTLRSGVTQLTFTFDDGSTQTVTGLTGGSTYHIPTNLNRSRILYIDDNFSISYVGAAAGAGAAAGISALNAASTGAAAGAGAATAVSNVTFASAGSAAGAGAAAATGLLALQSVGAAAGAGAAQAVSAFNAASVGAAAGAGGATAVSNLTAASLGAAAGSGAASGVSNKTSASVAASAGTGAATGIGNFTAASIAASAGVGAATGASAFNLASLAASAGVGAATGVSARTAASVAASAGIGAATGVSNATFASIATSSGAGAAQAVSAGLSQFTAAGAGAAAGVSRVNFASVGAASGSGIATAISAETLAAIASASGAGAASGISSLGAPATSAGTAAGAGVATGVGALTLAAVGAAGGSGDAFGIGAVITVPFPTLGTPGLVLKRRNRPYGYPDATFRREGYDDKCLAKIKEAFGVYDWGRFLDKANAQYREAGGKMLVSQEFLDAYLTADSQGTYVNFELPNGEVVSVLIPANFPGYDPTQLGSCAP